MTGVPEPRGRASPALTSARHSQAPRRVDVVTPGFYLWRSGKGRPLVPARIVHEPTPDPGNEVLFAGDVANEQDRSWWWSAVVCGQLVGEPTLIPWLNDTVLSIHERGTLIGEAEYEFRVADAAWAREHRPNEPVANPNRKVDLRTCGMLF